MTAIKDGNTDTDPEGLTELIDTTVREVCRERAKKRASAVSRPRNIT